MEQYIDKSALVAEINALLDDEFKCNSYDEATGFQNALTLVKKFIDTLEVKEVDFDVLGTLAEHLIACEAHGVTPKYRDREIDLLEKLKNNKAQKEN